MKDLKYFQNIIKEKRKTTDFRGFLKEIVSWCPLNLQKVNGVISRYPDTDRIKKIVYSNIFEKNRDLLLEKGIKYNFEDDFFSNYKKLFLDIDFGNVSNYGGNENSDFSDMSLNAHNSYISFIVINNCENVLYSVSVKDNCKDILNSISIWDSSNIVYKSVGILRSFKIFYSKFLSDSNNIWFSSNLIGCSECIFCDDLENQQYCINNKKLDKEEYFNQKEKILKDKESFEIFFAKVNKIGKNLVSENSKGSYIINSKNVENGYFCSNVNNGKNLILVGGVDGDSNMYDTFTAGAPSGEEFYGVMGANGNFLFNSISIIESSNIFYSYFITNCSYCIGCIGLKNKSYCILNKQFTKDEWEKEAVKIFSQMEQDGTLGNFFPGELNPFYFNDTVAGLIGGFRKEEVEKDGYMWRDEEIKVDIPEGVEVIKTTELDKYEGYDNDGKWKINPEILKVVIVDEKGNYYRIVKMEYDFLIKHELPLPRLHWLDRIKLGFGV